MHEGMYSGYVWRLDASQAYSHLELSGTPLSHRRSCFPCASPTRRSRLVQSRLTRPSRRHSNRGSILPSSRLNSLNISCRAGRTSHSRLATASSNYIQAAIPTQRLPVWLPFLHLTPPYRYPSSGRVSRSPSQQRGNSWWLAAHDSRVAE